MENINESPAVCKPKITALAQLVALYAECRGVTSTAELVAATGYTERAIRKAKAELGCRNQGAAGTRVPEPRCRPRNQGAVSEPQCRNQGADSASRTHANTELPSEVPSSQTVSQSVSGRPAEEFSNCKQAFNGATEAMVAEVIQAMGGNERDRPNAVKWLATTLASYGPDPVRDAFAMLATKRAENKPIASVLPWWSKTAATLKAKPKPAAAPAKGEAPRHRVSPDTIRYAKPAPGSEYIPEAANA